MIVFLRRSLVVLGIVLLLVILNLFLLAPQTVIDLVSRLRDASPFARTLQVVVAVILDALLIVLLYRLIRPGRTPGLMVRMRGARAEVSLDSVQRQINARIAQVSDVLDVQTEVEIENAGASVTLNVRTRPDIIIPEKQKEITRVLRQLVEKQMGLKLAGTLVIHITLASNQFEPEDRVTTVVEAIPHPVMEPRYTSLPATTYAALAAEEMPSAAAPVVMAPEPPAPEPAPEEEPWRAFLWGDDEQS